MNPARPNQRGIALVVVLLMVGIITAVTLQLNRDTRTEIYEAANLSDRFRLLYVAESALQAGGAILLSDTNTFDALTELWANTEMLALQFDRLFATASFKVTIEDEGGKIGINHLVSGGAVNVPLREMLLRLLTGIHFRLERRQAEDLLDAIQDWLDPDDEVTGGGAEGAYYAGLPQPYEAKNAPLDCIEELLMVKGMTRELFYGTAELTGLVRCLTVFGDGRININTAPVPVLLALAEEMRKDDAERLDEYRRDLRNDLSSPAWYQQITQPAGIDMPTALIVVRSDIFQITATGFQGQMQERLTAIVRRGADRKKVSLLSWKVA
jgi:general secretion pathway protein K